MKKLFTVLAVLLVASVAFAATFSGNVKAQYTFNFDEKTIGYGAPGFGAVDAAFKWDTGTVTVGGESDTHIDFAASASFEGWYNFSEDHADGYEPWLKYKKYDGNNNYAYSPAEATIVFYGLEGQTTTVTPDSRVFYALLKLDIDTFKIVGKDWEVDFLGDVGLNFAKSAIDSARFNNYTIEDNTVNYSLNNSVKGQHNLAVTAFGGYKFGFGLGTEVVKDSKKSIKPAYDNWNDALNFALTATTPEYDFNGVKAQFGAGYQVYDSAWKMAASAKASYAADKWSLGGAVDADIAKKAKEDESFVRNEIAVNFGFAPVAVDLYWNNEGAEAKDKYHDYFVVAEQANHKLTLGSNYLSAKVVVDVAKVAENVPVTVTVTGKNLINADKQILNLEASTTVVPNFKFGAYFKDMLDQTDQSKTDKDHRKVGATVEFTGLQNLTLNAEVAYKFAKLDTNKKFLALVGASYAHELFTASAAVACDKVYDQEVLFAAKAAVVSTTLVEGAELSAKAYFNLNNSEILDEGSNATNKLALACKVTF